MKLLGLHIEGYGTLKDFTLAETALAGNPCFIYGLNETGKSTLLSFIRSILFGFKTEGAMAVPVHGGALGGHMLLSAGAHVYRVQRQGSGNGKVVVEVDGQAQGGEEMLRTGILQGVSPVLFKNIFAMGVDELRALEALNSSEVNVYIYGAGTGTDPRRLAEAATTLDKTANDLFKPRGRVQILHKLVRELDEITHQIRTLEQQPEHYVDLKQKIRTLELERQAAQEQMEQEQRQLNHLAMLIKAREAWQQHQNLQLQLANQELIPGFPPAGLERWENLKVRRREKQEQWQAQMEKIKAIEKQLALLPTDEKILTAAAEIIELDQGRMLYRDKLDDLPNLVAKVRQGENALQQRLADVGLGLDETAILTLDTSLAIKSQVDSHVRQEQEYGQKILFAANRVDDAQRDLAHLQEEKNELTRQLSSLQNNIKETLVPPKQGLSMLEQATQKITQAAHWEELKKLKQNQLDEIKQRLDRLAGAAKTKTPVEQKIKSGLFLLLLVAIVIASSFWQQRLNGFVVGMILVLATLFYSRWRLEQKIQKARADNLKQELANEEKAYALVEQEISELAGRITAMQVEISDLAQALTGQKTITMEQLPELRQFWQNQFDQQRQIDALTEQLEKARLKLQKSADELAQAEQDSENWITKQQELKHRWLQWLQQVGWPNILPAHATAFIVLVEDAKEKIQQLQLDRLHTQQTKDAISDYEQNVQQLALAIGAGDVMPEQTAVYVAGLRQNLAEQQKLAEQRKQLTLSLQQVLADEKLAQDNLAQLEQELNQLLMAADARDEEHFRLLGENYQKQQDIKQRARALWDQLLLLAGSKQELMAWQQELTHATLQQHKEQHLQLVSGLRENQSTLNQLADQRAALKQQIKDLENGAELAEARQQKEMLQQSLAVKARQWQVTVLSQALLELAKQKHERERQPAVLELASRYFHTMTGGRYVRVVTPVGAAAKLEVELPHGGRVPAASLSRGAVNQLYLALRLALACHFSDLVLPLPVILDDVLVDFDAPRLRGTLQVLGQVAEKLQVIVLTCHNYLLDMAQQELTGISVINMEGQPKIAM